MRSLRWWPGAGLLSSAPGPPTHWCCQRAFIRRQPSGALVRSLGPRDRTLRNITEYDDTEEGVKVRAGEPSWIHITARRDMHEHTLQSLLTHHGEARRARTAPATEQSYETHHGEARRANPASAADTTRQSESVRTAHAMMTAIVKIRLRSTAKLVLHCTAAPHDCRRTSSHAPEGFRRAPRT